MPTQSAGLLLFRHLKGRLEVLLVHPGGPYWQNKDLGAWTIPKGEPLSGEDLLETACREFTEETGFSPKPPYMDLGEIRQKGGKLVTAWAFEGDVDAKAIKSNTFEMEWPPRSGRKQSFPEIDKAEYFDMDVAREKINPAQTELLDRLINRLRN